MNQTPRFAADKSCLISSSAERFCGTGISGGGLMQGPHDFLVLWKMLTPLFDVPILMVLNLGYHSRCMDGLPI